MQYIVHLLIVFVEADSPYSSILSINGASSNTKSDNASERPESSLDETAFTCEPFLYRKDSLLSSIHFCFNQLVS